MQHVQPYGPSGQLDPSSPRHENQWKLTLEGKVNEQRACELASPALGLRCIVGTLEGRKPRVTPGKPRVMRERPGLRSMHRRLRAAGQSLALGTSSDLATPEDVVARGTTISQLADVLGECGNVDEIGAAARFNHLGDLE